MYVIGLVRKNVENGLGIVGYAPVRFFVFAIFYAIVKKMEKMSFVLPSLLYTADGVPMIVSPEWLKIG